MDRRRIATWSELGPLQPACAPAADLVVVRWPEGEQVSVLYGRCLHRGALLADGKVQGEERT